MIQLVKAVFIRCQNIDLLYFTIFKIPSIPYLFETPFKIDWYIIISYISYSAHHESVGWEICNGKDCRWSQRRGRYYLQWYSWTENCYPVAQVSIVKITDKICSTLSKTESIFCYWIAVSSTCRPHVRCSNVARSDVNWFVELCLSVFLSIFHKYAVWVWYNA